MFDFEKLDVYKKAKTFNKGIYKYLTNCKGLDRTTNDQLRRASFSIMLNIAEGASRFSKAGRKNFMIIARGSSFECVAILDFLKDTNLLEPEIFNQFYAQAEELSKMLFSMIKNLEKGQNEKE
jgi:four helix bundle protein